MKKKKSIVDTSAAARENYLRYAYCRDNGHTEYVQKANLCLDYLRNKQWKAEDLAKLNTTGRPALTINMLLPTVTTMIGEFLSNRNDVGFRAAKNGTDEIATVLTKLFINIANNNKLDQKEITVLMRGLATGRGFYDIRISFEDQMRGEVRITTPRSQNVVLSPDMDDMDPDTWPEVGQTKLLSLNEIELMYGPDYAELVKNVDATSSFDYDTVFEDEIKRISRENADPALSKQYRVYDRQHRQLRYAEFFVDPETGDMRQVPDAWGRDQIAQVVDQTGLSVIKRRVQNVRWTTSIDSYLLHDDWSPYNCLTIVPFFPFMIDGQPIGAIEGLLGAQDMLNKTSSQELHILNTSSNSGWKFKTGSLVNLTREELETRGAETGLVLEMANIDDIEKIEPGQVPTGHDRLSYKAGEYIKEMSGVSDTMRGMDREDVSSKAILAKQARSQVALAWPFTNLNMTRQMLAEKTLHLVQTYYTEERIVNITGGTIMAPRQETLLVNEVTAEGEVLRDLTIGEYSVVLSPAPARSNFNESQFAELISLRELGIQIPPELLIEYSNVADKRQLIDSIKELTGQTPSEADAAQQQAQQQLAKMEAALAEAEVRKAGAEASLAEARASKAATEAEALPEEMALEQEVQSQQLEIERTRQVIEALRMKIDDKNKSADRAVELTKIDVQKEMKADDNRTKVVTEKAKAEAAKATAKAAAKNKPKAAAKKKPTPKK
jgi:hypothetical protein